MINTIIYPSEDYALTVYKTFTESLKEEHRSILSRNNFLKIVQNNKDEAASVQTLTKECVTELRKKSIINKRFSFEKDERIFLLTEIFKLAYDFSPNDLTTAAERLHSFYPATYKKKTLIKLKLLKKIQNFITSSLCKWSLYFHICAFSFSIFLRLLERFTAKFTLFFSKQDWLGANQQNIVQTISKIFKHSQRLFLGLCILLAISKLFESRLPRIPYFTNFLEKFNIRQLNKIFKIRPDLNIVKMSLATGAWFTNNIRQYTYQTLAKKIKQEEAVLYPSLQKTFLTLNFNEEELFGF